MILQARYGTAREHVDVTARLRAIARHSARVQLTPALLGAAATPGRDAALRIFARDRHGCERRFEYPERAWIDGRQFAGWSGGRWGDPDWRGGWYGRPCHAADEAGQYVILYASYGTPSGREINVTSRLRGLAQRDPRFRLAPGTFGLDTDPVPGRRRLLIVARDTRGELRNFEYAQDSWVDGTPFAGWASGDWGDGAAPAEHADPRPGQDDGAFTILSATYGTPRRELDVTARLRELAQRDRRFQLGHGLFGVAADAGGARVLRIVARDRRGAERSFEYRDGAWVDGAQFIAWGAGAAPPGRLWIDSASYGSEGRWVDVTRTLRERVRGERFEADVGQALLGPEPDPAPAPASATNGRRTLRISYRVGNGPAKTVEVAEHGRLRLP